MPEIILLAAAKQAGLKRYFTGKPCPRGHVAERFVIRRQCTVCNGINGRAWNRAKTAEFRRAGKLRAKYGMTLSDFDAMLARQGGCCKCCGGATPKDRNGWQVDHCHNTGRVRGILCARCNHAIGHAGDSVETLQAMIEYLRQSMQ